MAIAVGATSKGRTASAATIATAGVTTQVSGSTFVMGMVWSTAATFSTLVDSKGNTYTQVGTELTSAAVPHARFYYCENGIGGASHTGTITISGAATIDIFFLEITGAAVASFDLGNRQSDGASPYTSPGILTTQAAEMLVSFLAADSGSNPATHAESTGFIIQSGAEETNGASFWTGCLATRIVAATGTYNSSFTESGATASAVYIAAFKEGASDTLMGQIWS